MHPDRLKTGTPIEGWGGTAAPDHNAQGLYREGPLPTPTFYQRMVKSNTDTPEPLSPALAQLVLTREAQRAQRLRQMVLRACIDPSTAHLPPEAVRKRLTAIKRSHKANTKRANATLRQG